MIIIIIISLITNNAATVAIPFKSWLAPWRSRRRGLLLLLQLLIVLFVGTSHCGCCKVILETAFGISCMI